VHRTLLPTYRLTVLPTLGVALLLALGTAPPLRAQTANVVVRETDAGPAVAGAIVRLYQGDSVIAQGLTGESGRATLRAGGAGRFTIRVSRIGYAVSPPTPIELAIGETRSVELAFMSERIHLPELVVQGRTSCGKSPAERAMAATLWEQIRQALTATTISERAGLALRSRKLERTLSLGGAVVEERLSEPRVTGSRPFVPLPLEVLAREGYVLTDGDSVVFRAPDADVLLSESFVGSHCFGVTAPPADSTRVGLTFEPTRERQVADIRGVLWVDRRTLELRRLEFRYVARGSEVQVTASRGHLEFDRLPNGEWYIRSWMVRMPQIERTQTGTTYRDAVAGYREHGGSAEPLRGAGIVAPAYLTGRVWDSLAGQGLPGVVVTVAGNADSVMTDSLGNFEMALPVVGIRQVTFRHPLLALEPARAARTVELIPAAMVNVQIGTLGVDGLVRTICAAGRGKAGLVGIVLARDAPLAGLTVTAAWVASPGSVAAVNRTETTTTAESGVWAFCDLPPGAAVRLQVGEGSSASEVPSVSIDAEGFRWLPLSILRTGRAVIATEAGQRLPELKARASRAVAADRRFLEDARDRVARSGAPASALITRADLEKSNSNRILPLLMTRGLKTRVNLRTGKESLTCARKNERPAIYLNGMLVEGSDTPGARRMRVGVLGEVFDLENLSPDNVEAIEVYRSMSERPPEYNRTQSECVVVIWTRRG